jgi:hypothetical protein
MGGRRAVQPSERRLISMSGIQPFLQWFSQNPLGAATVFYVTAVLGVLVYAYFEPSDQR